MTVCVRVLLGLSDISLSFEAQFAMPVPQLFVSGWNDMPEWEI